jgi:small subunit ribosomal protein S1
MPEMEASELHPVATTAESEAAEAPESPIEAASETVSTEPGKADVLVPETAPETGPATPTENSRAGATEPAESFSDILSQFEKSHSQRAEDSGNQIEATVVALTVDSALFDIGFKTEGILPFSALAGKEIKLGDKFPVSVKGRDAEGYYGLSLLKVIQPTDWSLLEQAFANKEAILGTVTGLVKGGLNVDVGTRAFMPASRSGARDATELANLVGQQLRVRIIKLDVTDEDIVVDRRIIAEEEALADKERRYAEVREGDILPGTVRSLAEYGAFVDLGGVDGLLHVSDIAWSRVTNPSSVLSVGQQIEVKVLKVDSVKRRISLGIKQLQPEPWDLVPEKYKTGDRIRGTVTRLADFGVFVEIEPGVEGLIHLSEMSWAKKTPKPGDIFRVGENVEAIVLGIKPEERRISLGFKQLLPDPWEEAARKFASGQVVEGPVTSFTKFGAFVQIAEGVEGMVHISEITSERRIHHPQDALKIGETVKALVLEADREKRQLKLSIKQMVPVSVDEYFSEHKAGDTVTGRVIDIAGSEARIELGEGIHGICKFSPTSTAGAENSADGKVNISSLGAMLQARWKGGAGGASAAPVPEPVRAGQIRAFHIAKIDPAAKTIQLTLT